MKVPFQMLTRLLVSAGKAFFVLDIQNFDVHLYKTLEQEKASQTFSICGGDFPELVSKFCAHICKYLILSAFEKES